MVFTYHKNEKQAVFWSNFLVNSFSESTMNSRIYGRFITAEIVSFW